MSGITHVHGNDNTLSLDSDLSQCHLCNRYTANDIYCNHCKPNTCLECGASHVYYDTDDHSFKCSHGCEYSPSHYSYLRVTTAIYNDDPVDTLAFAGPRLEYVIPENTPITVHETVPDTIPDDHVLGTHYTRYKNLLLNNGVEYPPNTTTHDDPAHEDVTHDTGTIRDNALFAWPHTIEYTEQFFNWDSDHVFFSIPRDQVRVSSYRFLDFVVGVVAPGDPTHTIPVKHYDRSLTFTVDALEETVTRYRRPVHPDSLYLSLD